MFEQVAQEAHGLGSVHVDAAIALSVRDGGSEGGRGGGREVGVSPAGHGRYARRDDAPLPWKESSHPGDPGHRGHGVLYRGPAFTVGYTRCTPNDPGKGCVKSVDANTVTFVRRGVFEYFSDRASVIADPTKIFFGARGEEFRTSHPGCVGDETMVLTPQADVLRDTLRASAPDAAEDPGVLFSDTLAGCSNATFLLHRRVFDLARAAEQDPLEIEEACQELLQSSISDWSGRRPNATKAVRQATARVHAEISEEVRRILASEYAKRLTLADLSRRVHTAPFHLCRIFRTHTGLTVHKYLTRLRVRAAVEQLASTESPLQIIALDVGLCSQSHLCDAFRRELGVSPARVRRALTDSLRWSSLIAADDRDAD